MGELQRRHLFFLDSRTSPRTVAAASAQRTALASLSRDIFLDDDPSPAAVAERFQAAIALARKQGSVVIIGHPHKSTLALPSGNCRVCLRRASSGWTLAR